MKSHRRSLMDLELQLESTWCLSYEDCEDAATPGRLLTIVSTSSLTTFYQHVNNIHVSQNERHSNLFLFKEGVNPDWCRERFTKGGRFSICTQNPDNNVDELWHEVLDLCIGGDNMDDAAWLSVCG
eukprot:GEMP01072621.1.p1 GENE.GEMP01072621.1~~GEMP01072621.1.p1  ORF type:complete len:126 (-),score=20.34 GEMP01072621.1:640-1017(-)